MSHDEDPPPPPPEEVEASVALSSPTGVAFDFPPLSPLAPHPVAGGAGGGGAAAGAGAPGGPPVPGSHPFTPFVPPPPPDEGSDGDDDGSDTEEDPSALPPPPPAPVPAPASATPASPSTDWNPFLALGPTPSTPPFTATPPPASPLDPVPVGPRSVSAPTAPFTLDILGLASSRRSVSNTAATATATPVAAAAATPVAGASSLSPEEIAKWRAIAAAEKAAGVTPTVAAVAVAVPVGAAAVAVARPSATTPAPRASETKAATPTAAGAGAGATAVAASPRRETKEVKIAAVDDASRSFVTALLPWNFDTVGDQVEAGVYATKRVSSFLKKFCTLEEEHARKIQLALAHESSKIGKLQGDKMHIYSDAWSDVQRQFEKLTRQISQTSSRITMDVVVPLQEFHAAAEEKRRALVAEERKHSAEMAAARDAVVKGLMQTDKLIRVAQEVADKEKKQPAKKTGAAAFLTKVKTAVTKSAKTLQDQAHEAAIKYSQAIAVANKRQTAYLEVDLPRVFNAMQTLEQARLDVLKLRLARFQTIQAEAHHARQEILESMGKSIATLSPERDISTFIEEWVREHGPPLPSQPFVYGLQCTPDDIKVGRLEGSNPNSVFRTNLDQIMKIQRDSHPTLDYPAIMKVLIESIRAQGGYQAEGIFRISVAKTDLDELQAQFELGNYEVKATSPHTPAALLKAWLRSLLDPLVPAEHYLEAIETAKDPDAPASRILALFGKLPPITKKVLEQLAWMCQEISNETNSAITRMNMENLAIVFAPSLLRNPSEDPMVLLSQSKYETRFTVLLFKAIPASRAA